MNCFDLGGSAAKHVHLLVVAQGEGFLETMTVQRGFPPEAPVEVAPGEFWTPCSRRVIFKCDRVTGNHMMVEPEGE